MTEQQASSGEVAVEPASTPANHTKLDRLFARAMENYSAGGSIGSEKPDVALMLSEQYSGPFAHPAVLVELDKIIEHGAERAFRLTEKEQAHRHSVEDAEANSIVAARKAESVDRRLVIILVFTFLILCLSGAFVCIITGHSAGGGLVGGAGAIITAAALLIARSKFKKDTV